MKPKFSRHALGIGSVTAIFVASLVTAAGAQDHQRYAPGGVVARLKQCIRLHPGPDRITARNDCDVTIHVLACARDRSGCDDSDVEPGGEQRMQVAGEAEFYACPRRAAAVDLNDSPITSAGVSEYRCIFL